MNTESTVREKQLNVRLTDEEDERFTRVANHFGLSPAALVRMLVMEKARELGMEGPGVRTRIRRRAAEEATAETAPPPPKKR